MIEIPKILWCLLISGIILFFVSQVFAFHLYMPWKYIMNTLPIFILIVFALTITGLMDKYPKHQKKIFIGFILLMLLCYVPQMVVHSHQLVSWADCDKNIELYEFIGTLDKNVFIADYPANADCMAFFSKRKIFISYELTYPLYKNFWNITMIRTYDYFNMYYSDSTDVIYDFCKRNNVDYVIAYQRHFTGEYTEDNVYFVPFNDYIKNLIENNKGFILGNPDNFNVVHRSKDVSVVRCK